MNNKDLITWNTQSNGLPFFSYQGNLPFSVKDKKGHHVHLHEDPFVLLGNYRINLFVGASGNYRILSGERSWSNLNYKDLWKGGNYSTIVVNGVSHDLISDDSYTALGYKPSTQKILGVGFARFEYLINGLKIVRRISVKPNTNLKRGTPCFITEVYFENVSDEDSSLNFEEGVLAHYQLNLEQRLPEEKRVMSYETEVHSSSEQNVVATFLPKSKDPIAVYDKNKVCQYEVSPPHLYLTTTKSPTSRAITISKDNQTYLSSQSKISLKPGEVHKLCFEVGYYFDDEINPLLGDSYCLEEIQQSTSELTCESYWSQTWRSVVPSFEDESDPVLQREMTWNAACLEAMVSYKYYYDEFFIPQGTGYDYAQGICASVRDHAQHVMPMIYYRPELVESVIRYILKRTIAQGDIYLNEFGYGFTTQKQTRTSDHQLYLFLLVNEYLRVTKRYEFLLEHIEYHPGRNTESAPLLYRLVECFTFLKDEIKLGKHHIIRLCNADWNDLVFSMYSNIYNDTYRMAESHMNSAMGIVIIKDMVDWLEKAKDTLPDHRKIIDRFCESLSLYYEKIKNGFLKDLEGRSFPKRLYFNETEALGDDIMFFEPQGFTMQIPDLSDQQKATLYDEVYNRLIKGEVLGARQQEAPIDTERLVGGSRENGGFWYALNGPWIVGVAMWDFDKGMELLRKMTFANFTKHFPEYWHGMWSGPDNLESSLLPTEGLPDQKGHWGYAPVYCGHAHAWPLYCYLRLSEK